MNTTDSNIDNTPDGNTDSGGDGEWISSSTAPDSEGRAEMRRRADGGVDLRNSAHPDVVLHYTRGEFLAWLDGVSKREFDHLATDTSSTDT